MNPPVDPILLQLGPITIHWYGVLVVTGILLGTQVATYLAQRSGQNPEHVWDMLLVAVACGIIGARIEYVIVKPHWAYFKDNLTEAFYIWNGGLRIYGAIIGGAIGTLIYARFARVNALQFMDFAAPGMAMGHAIGRWGNFINYELYGPPTTLPWGLDIPLEYRVGLFRDINIYPLSTRFHPAFLYESIANLLLCLALVAIADRFRAKLRPGTLVIGYLIGYSIIRFLMDYMRTDGTSAQGIALVFIIASSALLMAWYLPRRKTAKG
ncbi:MAG: prolipoprotein diacylglyceryl transferase [Anaerolineae bacterium]|nr:prolipoprotein diacylglyceryl transferase [Anaerolineae bacterium]